LKEKLPDLQDRQESSVNPKNIISEDPIFKEFFDMAHKIGQGHETGVLISGETGTGKELLTRYIHTDSPGRDVPFVSINCVTVEPSRGI